MSLQAQICCSSLQLGQALPQLCLSQVIVVKHATRQNKTTSYK